MLAEFLTVQAHVELAKLSLRVYHTMHRKCVEQLIREDAARGDLRGQLRCRAGPAGFEMRTERSRLGRAAGRRSFHRNVAQGSVEAAQLPRREVQDVLGEPPGARAGFHRTERLGLSETLPHLGKLSRQQPAKNGVDVHTGIKIGKAPPLGAAVVAVLGVVEALAHELGKGQGAALANPLSE